jgi:hypothetical protein
MIKQNLMIYCNCSVVHTSACTATIAIRNDSNTECMSVSVDILRYFRVRISKFMFSCTLEVHKHILLLIAMCGCELWSLDWYSAVPGFWVVEFSNIRLGSSR